MNHRFPVSPGPFRDRWRAGRGTVMDHLRSAAGLLSRDRGKAALLVFLLWVLPSFLLTVLDFVRLGQASASANPLGTLLGQAGGTTWADLGASLLSLIFGILLAPYLCYALALLFRAEQQGGRPTPLQVIRVCVEDWRRALPLVLLSFVLTQLLTLVPTLLGYVMSLLMGLLSALLGWISGASTVLSVVATVLMGLIRGFFRFLGYCLVFLVFLAATEEGVRGLGALMSGIQTFRKRIGVLFRLYAVCAVPFILGSAVWLFYGLLGMPVHWLIPGVVVPLLEGAALLLAFAGTVHVEGGGETVYDAGFFADHSPMKSANPDE